MERGNKAISYQLSAISYQLSAISYQLSAHRASLTFSTGFRGSVLRILRSKPTFVFSLVAMLSSPTFGQVQFASTPDSPLYATNQACTSGVACWPSAQPPFAQIGNSVNYDLPYTNSGAFKLEIAGTEFLTWVTDYERNDFYAPLGQRASISHWDVSSSTATSPPTLLQGTGSDQDEFDPDVVQMGDELFAIYYSILYDNSASSFGFPGNGSVPTDEYRVIFERFTASDPPVQLSVTEIQNEPSPDTVLYAKNPNIDVSINNQIAMVWEEQITTESSNHVYARTYDAGNGLSATPFDLNPLNLNYKAFFNPDVACSYSEESSLLDDDQPVYITFMGIDFESNLQLLVYHATYGEIRTAATPNVANLYVVDLLNMDGTLFVGTPIKDYLSRPRIASRPIINFDGTFFDHQYNIVVPELSTGNQYGTNINGYVPFGTTYTKTVYTQNPASSVDIDCHVNYEPCTDVNQDGYEIVWNADQLAIWPGYSPNSGFTVNPWCSPFSYYEQTILRKTCDIAGNAFYSDYSIVPDAHFCCFTYTPSVAYDRFQITGGSSGPNANFTFFGFQHDIYDQNTFYKLSLYTNQSLKRDWQSEAVPELIEAPESASLVKLMDNYYQINHSTIPEGFKLIDIYGKQLNTDRVNVNSASMTVDLNGLPSGIYLIHLFHNGQPTTYKLQSIR